MSCDRRAVVSAASDSGTLHSAVSSGVHREPPLPYGGPTQVCRAGATKQKGTAMLLPSRGARLTSVVAAAGALAIGMAGTAQADTAGRPGDIVGVGSDTLQNAVNFVFDGAPGVTGA